VWSEWPVCGGVPIFLLWILCFLYTYAVSPYTVACGALPIKKCFSLPSRFLMNIKWV
jgi:hypothetical protein